MITGIVTAGREAIIRLKVRGPNGRWRQFDAVVDTGFDGWLCLPSPMIAQLGLPWCRRGRAQLADGSECVFDIFEGTALWHRRAQRITVDEADTMPLVGMALLHGSRLEMEIRAGGKVILKRL